MDQKYFTLVRKDVLNNPDLSLSAKGLYCLICYDLTKSLRRLLINPNTREETINSSKELEKYDYAHFDNLEECVDKNSYLGLHVSIQPTDEFKSLVDQNLKNWKDKRRCINDCR